jgi:hypothetical protein
MNSVKPSSKRLLSQEENVAGIEISIYGDGPEKRRSSNSKPGILLTTFFFEPVLKREIASILQADVFVHTTHADSDGGAPNKFYDYLAAASPSSSQRLYLDLVDDIGCGLVFRRKKWPRP